MPNPENKIDLTFNGGDCELKDQFPCGGTDIEDFGLVWLVYLFDEWCPIKYDGAGEDALAMMTRVVCVAALLRTTDLNVITHRLASRRTIVRPLLEMLDHAGWLETLLPDLQAELAEVHVDPGDLNVVIDKWVAKNIVYKEDFETLIDLGEAIGDAANGSKIHDTISFEPWMVD
jgi:hypothetical protein